ncbi:MAG TPA: hypothetical protein VMH61_04565 [Candidatus Acidoferrales bacterium]|nr:hypothetical protein [Candidatus Acidoferrales bacterium]
MRIASALAAVTLLAAATLLPAVVRAAEDPAVVSRVPADVPSELLAAHVATDVGVRVHVRRDGTVDSVRAVSGDVRLRRSAESAVRWWIFARPSGPQWTLVHVQFDGHDDAEPLDPDVIALARDAETSGDLSGAIDDWCGALARVGQHPALRNEFAIREHILRLAARLEPPRAVPTSIFGEGQVARIQQERTVARTAHEELVEAFDHVLVAAPWWGEAYQWRAASQLACDRAADGLRSLRLFRDAAATSAARDIADRALARFAAGDTLGAAEILKFEGARFNRDEDAR